MINPNRSPQHLRAPHTINSVRGYVLHLGCAIWSKGAKMGGIGARFGCSVCFCVGVCIFPIFP